MTKKSFLSAKKKVLEKSPAQPNIVGDVTAGEGYAYAACWIHVGGQQVDLSDRSARVAPGQYELHWEFRHKEGQSFECTVTTLVGAYKTGPHTLKNGKALLNSTTQRPDDYEPVTVVVA